MPSKKRRHGRRGKDKQKAETEGGNSITSPQSQPKPPTSTPAVPVSTVKPAQYEKGASSSSAASAAKPVVTTAGTVPTSTTTTAGASAGAKVSGGPTSNVGIQSGSKVTPQTPPKAPVTIGSGAVVGTGGSGATGGVGGAGKPTTDPVKPKDAEQNKAQTTTVPTSKTEPAKVTPAGVGGTAQKETKVQGEVRPPVKSSTPAAAADPFDALAGTLPSSAPQPPKPQFTGPEVKESGLTSEKAKRCGEDERTLPPGYRKEDMEKKIPAGTPEKPKEVPKPLTDDEALTSLSAGFVSSAVPSAPKSSATPAKAPPVGAGSGAGVTGGVTGGVGGAGKPTTDPVKPKDAPKDKAQTTVASSTKPEPPKTTEEAKPAAKVSGGTTQKDDAKAKDAKVQMEVAPVAKAGAPVQAGTPEKPTEASKRQDVSSGVSPAPPADKKAKVEKPVNQSVKPADKPKPDQGDMSLDALRALGDTLPVAKPQPEAPKLRPQDIVDEKKHKSEKGVLVGEREDSIPPEYRFKEDKLNKHPAPPKEPSMDSAEALDILSGGFSSSAAPVVQAPPPPPPSASAKKQPKVEDLSALDALAGDFVAPVKSKKVESAAPPSAKSTPAPTADQGDSMSLDALNELGDLLPDADPVPKSPKLRPEDIIDEEKLKSDKGVFVGEREDTLPPGYRFSEKDLKKHPAPPPKEPSMDPADALDILSGDFSSSAPVAPSAPPPDSSADFDLEGLDFVAPVSVSKVQSSAPAPPKADRQLSEGTSSAMDALSDTLMVIKPAPEPKPVSPKDIVKEKEAKEKRVIKPGERDDSIPAEYRPSEADIKAAAKAKAKADASPKQKSLDESAALDLLSGDFTSAPAAPVAPPPTKPHTPPAKTTPTQSAPKAQGPVLDKPATTPETKPKDSKPKKPADEVPAAENLTVQPSTDLVSTKKGGKS